MQPTFFSPLGAVNVLRSEHISFHVRVRETITQTTPKLCATQLFCDIVGKVPVSHVQVVAATSKWLNFIAEPAKQRECITSLTQVIDIAAYPSASHVSFT